MRGRPALPLSACVAGGYEVALKQHHSFLVQNIVTAAVRAAPARSALVSKLGGDAEVVHASMLELRRSCAPVLAQLHTFLMGDAGVEKPDRPLVSRKYTD